MFFLFNSAIPSNILIFAIIKNIEAQIAEANMRQAMNKGEIPLEVIAIKILMLAPLLFTLFYSMDGLINLSLSICCLGAIYMVMNIIKNPEKSDMTLPLSIAKNNLVSFLL